MSASEQESQGPVIRDRRRIDPVTGQARHPGDDSGTEAGQDAPGTPPAGTQPRPGRHAVSKPGSPRPEAAGPGNAGGAPGVTGADGAGNGGAGNGGAAGSNVADLSDRLAERTADLQRIQAEYANYRKRVDRDRAAMRELSIASVLGELLPVLDDIGRAREHGELTGGFKSVAESLEVAVTKLGLITYGQAGEPFDPNVHEALMHSYSPDVTDTTCVQVLQPGYKVGERILRPARVAVAEPAEPEAPAEAAEPAQAADAATESGAAGEGDQPSASAPHDSD